MLGLPDRSYPRVVRLGPRFSLRDPPFQSSTMLNYILVTFFFSFFFLDKGCPYMKLIILTYYPVFFLWRNEFVGKIEHRFQGNSTARTFNLIFVFVWGLSIKTKNPLKFFKGETINPQFIYSCQIFVLNIGCTLNWYILPLPRKISTTHDYFNICHFFNFTRIHNKTQIRTSIRI